VHLGYNLVSTTIINSSITNTVANIASLSLPTSGYWLLSASLNFYGTGTGVNYQLSVDPSTTITQCVGNPISSYAFITLPAYIYNNTTANNTIYTQANNNGNTNTVYKVYFTAIRIA